MNEDLENLEREVEISRLKNNVLESKLKRLKKLEEIKRIEESIEKYEKILATKE